MNKTGEIILNTNIPNEIYSYHLSSIKYPHIIKQFDEFLKNNTTLIQQLKQKYDIREDF
jgi:hypothetical protein